MLGAAGRYRAVGGGERQAWRPRESFLDDGQGGRNPTGWPVGTDKCACGKSRDAWWTIQELEFTWPNGWPSVEVSNRRYIAGVPLPTLMLELGHESLAVTQDYLADVRKPGEAKKAVADADFVPKPNVVKTGTDGD